MCLCVPYEIKEEEEEEKTVETLNWTTRIVLRSSFASNRPNDEIFSFRREKETETRICQLFRSEDWGRCRVLYFLCSSNCVVDF